MRSTLAHRRSSGSIFSHFQFRSYVQRIVGTLSNTQYISSTSDLLDANDEDDSHTIRRLAIVMTRVVFDFVVSLFGQERLDFEMERI